MKIGVDLMGGDTPPEQLFEAVLLAIQQFGAALSFVVLATPEVVDRISSLAPKAPITYTLTPEWVAMSEDPLSAVRHKKRSSLIGGIRLLKKKQIDAFISTGNTGALIAAATLSLPHKPGIKRPALLANLPTEKGYVAVLDVGGNVSCKAHHLVQFAEMGADYQRRIRGIQVPRVGLLNIGIESLKGTKEVRQAYQLLSESDGSGLIFAGNIEAREVLQGHVDVLVTDGFSGNVLLKSIEGASAFIFHSLVQRLPQELTHAVWFKELKTHFDTEEYPGALLCGVEGIVVKCHGNASPRAFFNGIKAAYQLLNN